MLVRNLIELADFLSEIDVVDLIPDIPEWAREVPIEFEEGIYLALQWDGEKITCGRGVIATGNIPGGEEKLEGG